MTRTTLITLGLLLMLASVWGGCFASSCFPQGYWTQGPITFTTLLGWLCALWVVIAGANKE